MDTRKMRRIWRTGFLPILFLLASSPAALAADWYVGPEAGFGLLNSGAGSRLDYGISLGNRLLPNLLAGIYYDYIPFGSVSSPDGTSVSGSEKFYGFELRYDFTPLVSGLTFGARGGLSSISTQAITATTGQDNQSSSGFAWGPVLGYEKPISTSWTAGGIMYILIPSEVAANNVFGLLATLKFWF